MISPRKKKQQNRRLFCQLGESDANFSIGQSDHDAQTESRANAADGDTSLSNRNNLNQVEGSQVGLHTLEENLVRKVQNEVDSVMTTVETRVQGAVLTAIENLVIPRIELAMKSVNASTERVEVSVVLNPDQRDFSGNIESLQLTASSRLNSHTNLNRFDETRGNITVESGDLLVNGRNIDRQTHTHHRNKTLFVLSYKSLP